MKLTRLSLILVSGYFLFALFNPVLKKYDYGAGWPLVLAMGVLVLLLLINDWKKARERAGMEKGVLATFGVMVAISFVFSQTKHVGLSEVMAYISVTLLYFVLAHQRITWKEGFLRVVAGAAFLAVLEGFWFYFTKGETRMFGPFFNVLYHNNLWPNAFALFLVLSWPVYVYLAGRAKGRMRWFIVGMLAVVLSGLLLTYSRAAFIAFGGQLVLMGLFFARRLSLRSVGVAGVVTVIALGIFAGANFVRSLNHQVIDLEARVKFENQESLTSKQERVEFWKGAFALMQERPLTGYGPFSFRHAYNRIQTTFLASSDHPHNIFLKIGAENGVVAMAAFSLFLLIVLGTVLRRFSWIPVAERPMLYVLAISVLGALAHNLVDYNFNFMATLTLFFVFLAFIRSMVVRESVPLRIRVSAIFIVLLALFSVYEGTVFLLYKGVNRGYIEHSFFPRNYYLSMADAEINSGRAADALPYLEKQLALTPIDAQAWYLRGVVCERTELKADECLVYYEKALTLNPQNDLNYYHDYLRALQRAGRDTREMVKLSKDLLLLYYGYVQNNVHFTAYTPNVEAAVLLTERLIPFLSKEEAKVFSGHMKQMIQKAEALRAYKTF